MSSTPWSSSALTGRPTWGITSWAYLTSNRSASTQCFRTSFGTTRFDVDVDLARGICEAGSDAGLVTKMMENRTSGSTTAPS